eukprot:Lankesteria_metandrocarpae@DN2144_c0_g1_i1.p1
MQSLSTGWLQRRASAKTTKPTTLEGGATSGAVARTKRGEAGDSDLRGAADIGKYSGVHRGLTHDKAAAESNDESGRVFKSTKSVAREVEDKPPLSAERKLRQHPRGAAAGEDQQQRSTAFNSSAVPSTTTTAPDYGTAATTPFIGNSDTQHVAIQPQQVTLATGQKYVSNTRSKLRRAVTHSSATVAARVDHAPVLYESTTGRTIATAVVSPLNAGGNSSGRSLDDALQKPPQRETSSGSRVWKLSSLTRSHPPRREEAAPPAHPELMGATGGVEDSRQYSYDRKSSRSLLHNKHSVVVERDSNIDDANVKKSKSSSKHRKSNRATTVAVAGTDAHSNSPDATVAVHDKSHTVNNSRAGSFAAAMRSQLTLNLSGVHGGDNGDGQEELYLHSPSAQGRVTAEREGAVTERGTASSLTTKLPKLRTHHQHNTVAQRHTSEKDSTTFGTVVEDGDNWDYSTAAEVELSLYDHSNRRGQHGLDPPQVRLESATLASSKSCHRPPPSPRLLNLDNQQVPSNSGTATSSGGGHKEASKERDRFTATATMTRSNLDSSADGSGAGDNSNTSVNTAAGGGSSTANASASSTLHSLFSTGKVTSSKSTVNRLKGSLDQQSTATERESPRRLMSNRLPSLFRKSSNKR